MFWFKFEKLSSALFFLPTRLLFVHNVVITLRMEGFISISSTTEKKIIKEGIFGRKPAIGWTCSVTLSYEGQDTTENLEIVIGNGCSARDREIEFCVESMLLEEESLFRITIEKEKRVLMIKIILTSFQEKPYIFQWTDEEKLEASNFYKAQGNELFKEGNVEGAFYKFSMALKFTLLLDSTLEKDEPGESITSLRTALYNNLAGCHLQFKNYLFVVELCSSSVNLQPTVKAYYRRAVANIELKEYEKAETDLVELLKMEPKNKAALEKYKLVRELDKSNRENYKHIVQKMFQ